MNTMMKSPLESAETDYAMLRVALELFHTPPASLGEEEYQHVLHQVNRELAIGKRVLQAREAADVIVPETVVEQAIAALRTRFDSETEFLQELAANRLDRDTLYRALHYELRVEAVLERILAERASVSDAEVEIYYLQHLDKFELPETRTARHILLTINEEYAENSREQATRRIAALQHDLLQNDVSFSELAQRHSECPTAMQEGLLGRIKPGQLYPELDQQLFDMEEGELSEIIESPVGLHLLLCERIHPAERRRFGEVREKLLEHLEAKKRKKLLREWLYEAVTSDKM